MTRLSIVVVVHDMRREAPRTLHTLSAAHQRDVTAADYEVIVVENGSSEPLEPDQVKSFGENFRYVRIDDATPSPGPAINAGVALSDAPTVGVMVDGARMATPGVVRWALRASESFQRPVTATIGFHLGEFQPRAIEVGYDVEVEDQLLDEVGWREDGYRLYEIAGLAGSSLDGWFAPLGESNLLFMPRLVFDELGGYDEAFQLPGGGLVNLDFYKRAAALLDVEWIVLLGEATFHQIHGGAATNRPQSELGDTLKAFQAEYKSLRGETMIRSPRTPTLFGAVPAAGMPWLARMGTAQGAEAPAPVGAWRSRDTRYLDLLKQTLLDEHGLEAEAAYFLARDALDEAGVQFDDTVAYDIRARARAHFERVESARHNGLNLRLEPRNIGFAYTMIGRLRLENVEHCVSTVLSEDIPGDLVECGAWRGGASILMRGILAAHGVDDRAVWVADSFCGLPEPEPPHDTLDLSADVHPELAVSQERVAASFARFGLLDAQVRFLEGWFKETLPTAPIARIAVLRLDGDLYESTMTTLTALYDKVSPGGFVIVDDYKLIEACKEAVDEFRAARDITDQIVEIDWAGVYWRRPA